MEIQNATSSFAALAHETRLRAVRLLVSAMPDGLAAGALAQALGVPGPTLSSHLNILAQAGLVSATRHSRSIIYQANIPQLVALGGYLIDDCCNGRPVLCDVASQPEKACC